ncbi:hypothetical protein [Variovorax sp. YR752]|uniref:hypothetical protein n=1 Tax=Variovorax sp. YR752 TaxID=1884383 RepID=UPI00117D2862|nr:hypothetical protein [Variovorax sp. YR752]
MTKTLTRTELYELIWTHPRSTLAKELGISDVAKRRIEIAREREAAEREREAKRLEEIAMHRQKVREHIVNLGKQRRAALDIREMVGVLSTHPELGPEGNPQFDDWVRLALDVADELDPMKRPLELLITGAGTAPER